MSRDSPKEVNTTRLYRVRNKSGRGPLIFASSVDEAIDIAFAARVVLRRENAAAEDVTDVFSDHLPHRAILENARGFASYAFDGNRSGWNVADRNVTVRYEDQGSTVISPR